jgi:hypothetical protein
MSNKKLQKLIKSFKKSICQVIYEANDIEGQKQALRAMISTFNMIGQDRGVPMIQYAIEIINKDFPHLKEDLDKLLLLI